MKSNIVVLFYYKVLYVLCGMAKLSKAILSLVPNYNYNFSKQKKKCTLLKLFLMIHNT